MRNVFKSVLAVSATALLVGCGGGSSSSDPINYAGIYDLTIVSSIAETETTYCAGAAGSLTVNADYSINGTVRSDGGYSLNLTGQVAQDGTVTGGIAVANENLAAYSGQLNSGGGTGQWQDIYGCYGTWSATKR